MRIIWSIIWGIIGGLIALVFAEIVISVLLDELAIKDAVKQECPEALKAVIEKKKSDAISVGIFDKNYNKIESTTIRSEQGVSDSLFVGQEIYIYD